MEQKRNRLNKLSWFFGLIFVLSIGTLLLNWLFGNPLAAMWEDAPTCIAGFGFGSFMISLAYSHCEKEQEQKIMNHAHPRA